MARRIMRRFVIKEISMVDRPANEFALAAIIKRRAPTLDPPRSTAPPQSRALDELAARLIAKMDAADARDDQREREQEATTMITDHDVIIAKRIDAQRSLDSAVAKRGPRETRYQAMEAWRRSHPREFQQLQANAPAAPPSVTISKAVEHKSFFDELCRQIVKRDNCTRTEAWERARIENRSAYERMQNA